MQLRISFMCPCLRFVEVKATGTEGSTFTLCNNTAFRLCTKESMYSRHSSGSYLIIAAIWPSTFLQALSSPCWRTAQNLLGGSEMLSLSQCRPEDSTAEVSKNNGSALFFGSSRSLMKSESSFRLTLMWFSRVYFREKFRISWSRWLPSALLAHWTIIRSYEIPFVAWKPEPFLNF